MTRDRDALAGPATAMIVELTPDQRDAELVGAKATGLAELHQVLGVRVPAAYVITTRAFEAQLAQDPQIAGACDALARVDAGTDPGETSRAAQDIQNAMLAMPWQPEVAAAILEGYRAFSRALGEQEALVSVRSSANAEDLAAASFAGQYESVLNVRGEAAVLAAVRRVWASAYSPAAVRYRQEAMAGGPRMKMAVIMQRMVQPCLAAGTVWTVDLETGAPLVAINAVEGLPDALMAGQATPDLYLVEPGTLTIVKRRRGVGRAGPRSGPDLARRPANGRRGYVLSHEQARGVAEQALAIAAQQRARHGVAAVDVEFAMDEGGVWILQARPETAWGRGLRCVAVDPDLASGLPRLMMAGVTGCPGVVAGRVRHAASLEQAEQELEPGEILVVQETTNTWGGLLGRAGGVVTAIGGPGSHTATLMRELGRPALVGAGDAIAMLRDGELVTLDATLRTIYGGAVPEGMLLAPQASAEPANLAPDVDEEQSWQEAQVMTTTYVDEAGERFIAKPPYRVSELMGAIYLEAHRQAGARLGIPTHVQLREGLHLVQFSDTHLWRQLANRMTLAELEVLNQERRSALAAYVAICRKLDPSPEGLRQWLEATTRVNAMMALSYTIYQAAERLLMLEASQRRLPALAVMQARQALESQLGPTQAARSLLDAGELQALVEQDRQLAEAVRAAAASGDLAWLKGASPLFRRLLNRYAFSYKVLVVQEPDAQPDEALLTVVRRLARGPAGGRAPMARPGRQSVRDEFFPEDPHFERVLRLALEAGRARQDGHHLRARAHWLTRRQLAGLAGYLIRKGEIADYAELFCHEPEWLVGQAERYVAERGDVGTR